MPGRPTPDCVQTAHRLPAAWLAVALLSACSEAPPPPNPVETEVPEEFRRPPAAQPTGASIGTPMPERVATLGLLNKRNNIAQDLVMRPGETRRIGDVVVALKACERTAPWEMPQQTGAFIQVFVQASRTQAGFGRVFSGWVFKESPSLNVVEHPIYDVWIKECAMRFPGEEAGEPDATAAPAAPRSPAPRPTASPSPTPEAPATNEDTA